ncbi:hypothetical protein [Roseovarius sp. D22-M7]|uniref:hypothetical protein n=1 Tax=Roseovarius sp. D22-M7 TaxID=3127116 RepID=UPI003010501D
MTILAATSEFDGFTELPALSALIRYTDLTESGPNSRVGNAVLYPARARLGFTPTNGVWLHSRILPRASSGAHDGPSWILGLEDGDGNVICGLWNPASGSQADDTFWLRTHAGVEAAFPVFGAASIDMYVKIGDPDGVFLAYVDGVLQFVHEGVLKPGTSEVVASVRVEGCSDRTNDFYNMPWAELIVADVPTLGFRLHTLPLVSDGTPAQFAGAVAGISTIEFAEVADAMVSDTVGQAHLFTLAGMPALPADTTIVGVSLVAAAFTSGASPVQRFDGRADAALLGAPVEIGDALGAVRFFWDVNPATGAAWTAVGIDATQFGLEALA